MVSTILSLLSAIRGAGTTDCRMAPARRCGDGRHRATRCRVLDCSGATCAPGCASGVAHFAARDDPGTLGFVIGSITQESLRVFNKTYEYFMVLWHDEVS